MRLLAKSPDPKKFSPPSQIAFAALRLGALALSVLCLWSGVAQAQVRISPMVLEAQADRGQAEGVVDVTNTGSEPLRARVYVESFTYGDGGFETAQSSSTDLSPYLQFSPRELTVPPNTTRRIRLITQLPPSLPDGEYRAVVFTENLDEVSSEDQAGNTVNIKTRIGVTVYVRKGNISPNLAVNSASFNSEQSQIQVLVSNTGQATARPSLNWTLKQGDTVVKTGNVPSTGVIAQSDRNLLLNFPEKDQPLTPGNYQLSGELVWGATGNSSSLPFNVNLTIPAN